MRNNTRDQARLARLALANLPAQLVALDAMTVAELRAKWLEVYGQPTTAGNRPYLKKQLAWKIQALVEGGLSERAKALIQELAAEAPIRWREPEPEVPVARDRDPRLPPAGTVLSRNHGGVTHKVTVLCRSHRGIKHEVTVLEDGFEYQGERYESLSRVAKAITGTNWNGFQFFRLQRPRRREEPRA